MQDQRKCHYIASNIIKMRSGHQSCSCRRWRHQDYIYQDKIKRDGRSVGVLRGDLERGDGFQAGLDVLLLPTVAGAEVKVRLVLAQRADSRFQPVDGALCAAATLTLAALRARRRGGRRRVHRLDAANRNKGQQTAGLLLGMQGEVAEDVLVMGAGSGGRQAGSRGAPLILKRHIGRVSSQIPARLLATNQECEYRQRLVGEGK